MKKILTSDLRSTDVEAFLIELSPSQTDSVWGSGRLFIYLTNVTDSITINSSGNNTVEAGGKNSFSYHDNTFNSIDRSSSIYNVFNTY